MQMTVRGRLGFGREAEPGGGSTGKEGDSMATQP
jgi:hypothetical protein